MPAANHCASPVRDTRHHRRTSSMSALMSKSASGIAAPDNDVAEFPHSPAHQWPQRFGCSRRRCPCHQSMHRITLRADKNLLTDACRLGVMVVPVSMALDRIRAKRTRKISHRSHPWGRSQKLPAPPARYDPTRRKASTQTAFADS